MLFVMVEGFIGLDMIDLVVELCFIFFVCLSFLFFYLYWLMKLLVFVFGGSDEFVVLGLWIFEFWIDSFNLEFLEFSMVIVMFDFILIFWFYF